MPSEEQTSLDSPCFTVEEAADEIGIRGNSHRKRKKIHALVRSGRLLCYEISPKERMFSKRQIRNFLESSERRGPPSPSDSSLPQKVVDKSSTHPVLSQGNGAETRVKDSGANVGKEIRSLCS